MNFNIPPILAVILIAMSPIFELRGAIPVAIWVYRMNPFDAFLLSFLGNILPIAPLLLFLSPMEGWLRRYRIFDEFFKWLFKRTQRRLSDDVAKYKALALCLFVAIPLPATGAWTGCAAAFIFGLKFRHAFPAIVIGVFIAGILVTLASIGVITLWDL
ncbi:MAG: small multi-drug export protein [Methanocellales archaeon]